MKTNLKSYDLICEKCGKIICIFDENYWGFTCGLCNTYDGEKTQILKNTDIKEIKLKLIEKHNCLLWMM